LPNSLTDAFLTLLAGPADLTEGGTKDSDLEVLCIPVGSALVQTVSKTRHTASIATTPGFQSIASNFHLRSRDTFLYQDIFKKPINLFNYLPVAFFLFAASRW